MIDVENVINKNRQQAHPSELGLELKLQLEINKYV